MLNINTAYHINEKWCRDEMLLSAEIVCTLFFWFSPTASELNEYDCDLHARFKAQ